MARFSDEQIRAYVEANIDNPAAIAEAAASAGVSMADLSRATGFSVADVSNYFGNAGVEIPVADNSAAEREAAAEAARQQAANEAAWARQQAENERQWAAQQAENQRQYEAQQAAQAQALAQQQAQAAAKAQADAAAKAQADAAAKPTGIAALSATTAPIDKAAAAEKLTQQILAQGTTSQWKGEGKGSAEKNAADMAKILADTGITDITQFGKVTKTVDAAVQPVYGQGDLVTDNEGQQFYSQKIVGYVDQNGKAIDPNLVKSETVYSGGDAGTSEIV